MKKIAIVGLIIILVLACALLLRRQYVKMGRFDQAFNQHLVGVWVRQEGSMSCTNTVEGDGSFVELSWFNHHNRTNSYQRTGTWHVRNGMLTERIVTSTNPTEVTPHTGIGRVVRADAGEFVVRWPNSQETVWRKGVQ